MVNANPTDFWSFSLAYYAKPNLADTCLQLQDGHGANVNLLLWALWLESQNKRLTPERLQQAITATATWNRDYVKPLRELRRNLKREFAQGLNQVAELRDHIKQAELLAEKHEQQWLERLASPWLTAQELIPSGTNAELYMVSLAIPASVIAPALRVFSR